MMRILFVLTTFIFCNQIVNSKTILVGINQHHTTIQSAASVALSGDSIVCLDPVMNGGMYIANLKGNNTEWIYILAGGDKGVILQGGTNSIQFSDCAFLHIKGFTFEGQTGNGLNIDDGGSFDSPTHHITITDCTFQNIDASGNNDLLKMSGLDDFEVSNCSFINGSPGGSGIDMVGCHHGIISNCTFSNLGTNSIQAKGGTSNLIITRNQFYNGGARALNLGGSTGLEFFRPQNATAEAQDIEVIANVIEGSEAAIAFVGSRNIKVSNNTILNPTKWVLRILQETVDPIRFLPCGENDFFNNIIVINNQVNTDVNIGPNTAPETFTFRYNLWYNTSDNKWSGPILPGTQTNNIVKDPLFLLNSKYILANNSPAIGIGLSYTANKLDILGQYFNFPPSIGAFEANPFIINTNDQEQIINVYPNPASDRIFIEGIAPITYSIYYMNGEPILINEEKSVIDVSSLQNGIYLLIINQGNQKSIKKFVVLH